MVEELLKAIPVSGSLRAVLGVGIYVILTVIFAYVMKLVIFGLAMQLTSKTKTKLDDKLVKTVGKHVFVLVYIVGAIFLSNYLENISEGTAGAFFSLIDGIIYVFGVCIVAHLIVRIVTTLLEWYADTIASKTETTVDDEFIPLLDRTTKVVVYTLSLLIILDKFDVDIKGLVTVLGVGSLAVALAAQDTIANMIGGFIIMVDRPFRKGDRVQLGDGTVCIVEQIGIRSTKFLTFDNTLIIWPNADIVKTTIHNLTFPFPQIRVTVDVGVSYDEDIALVRKVMLEEAANHEKVLKEPEPAFAFLNFGDSSLDVSLRCRVGEVSERFQTTCELREAVLNRFRKEGIEIPFPQRVVTMVQGDSLKDKPKPASINKETKKMGKGKIDSFDEDDT